MEIFRGIQELKRPLRHPVVTIGNFDGVHLGHRQIIQMAVQKARSRQGEAAAYTFRPHPQLALRPDSPVRLLSTYDEKLELLEEAGLDVVIEEPFGREFSETPPSVFFTDVILRRISAEAVVVGYDFAFGKGREGNLQVLEKFCKDSGIEFTVVSPVKIGNEVASSSKIRQHLLAGQIAEANALLGREFSYRGIVIRGDQRGRVIGCPTANIQPADKLAIPYGVYVTRSVVDGQVLPSVTSVGVRPTFEGANQPMVETHVLDFSQDLYGKSLEVRFVHRIRDEMKFSGVEELKAWIARDIGEARVRLGLR
jgi:riboflavin kinase/FMN adenylyltransferase